MKRHASHELLAALVGAKLSVLREDWGMRDMYVACLHDSDGFVIVQSLRHELEEDAVEELLKRWRERQKDARHTAWSITPAVDSLIAIGC